MNSLLKSVFLGFMLLTAMVKADGPAVHGMVIFGGAEDGKTFYASHVPMFHKPHDYQAIFEVRISRGGFDIASLYRGVAFKNGKQQLMTLMPKPFILPDLLSGKIKAFTAALFQGNFEDGGVRLVDGVTVTVNKIVHQKQLSLNTGDVDLTYLVLKDGYLVHLIAAPNSFDEIVQAKELLPEGMKVFTGTKDALDFRLGQGKDSVLPAFYCTVGPDFASPCG